MKLIFNLFIAVYLGIGIMVGFIILLKVSQKAVTIMEERKNDGSGIKRQDH